jgi:hypothetical protein
MSFVSRRIMGTSGGRTFGNTHPETVGSQFLAMTMFHSPATGANYLCRDE